MTKVPPRCRGRWREGKGIDSFDSLVAGITLTSGVKVLVPANNLVIDANNGPLKKVYQPSDHDSVYLTIFL